MTIGPRLNGIWVSVEVGPGLVVGITVDVALGGDGDVGGVATMDCETPPDASSCFSSGEV